MRFLLVALGAFGLYSFLRRRRAPGGPSALLSDMRDGRRKGADARERRSAAHVTYRVIEHDGGWAYRVGDVFSETYASRRDAADAAEQAAAAHESAGSDEVIEYQDRRGRWHEEVEPGDDRPETDVQRRPAPGE